MPSYKDVNYMAEAGLDELEGPDKEITLQSAAKLRIALKKSINKCKTLRTELDKSVENTQMLDAAVRERAALIFQLTTEKQQHVDEVVTLREQVTEYKSQMDRLADQLELQQSKINGLSNDKISLGDQLSGYGKQMDQYQELEGRLVEEVQRNNDLSSQVEALQHVAAQQKDELGRLKKQIMLNQASATSLLFGFGGGEESGIREMNETIKKLEVELDWFRSQPTMPVVQMYLEEKQKFVEARTQALQEMYAKQETIRHDRTTLKELRQTTAQARAELERQKNQLECDRSQYSVDKKAMDEMKAEMEVDRRGLEVERVECQREKSELEKQRNAVSVETEALMELRESRESECKRLEEMRVEIGDMSARFAEYRVKYEILCRETEELEQSQRAFADERDEACRIIALRSEVESKESDIREREAEVERIRKSCEQLEKAVNDRQMAVESRESELKVRLEGVEDREQDSENKLAKLGEDLARLVADREVLEMNIKRFHDQRERVSSEVEMVSQIDALKSKVSSQHAFIQQMKGKMRKLWERKKALKKAQKRTQFAQVKSVLLKFFAQRNPSVHVTLIPVLLGLLQCSEDEIQESVTHWTELHGNGPFRFS